MGILIEFLGRLVSADPGLSKEKIKVQIENSRYPMKLRMKLKLNGRDIEMQKCTDCSNMAVYSIVNELMQEIPLCNRCFLDFRKENGDQFVYVGTGSIVRLSEILDMEG